MAIHSRFGEPKESLIRIRHYRNIGRAIKVRMEDGWGSREFNAKVSNMGTTSVTLMRMVFTGLGNTIEAKKTIDYLWDVQLPDGRWTEDAAQLDGHPPEWNMPGVVEVDLWEIANNTAVLAAVGYQYDSRIEKAVKWVEQHAREDGTFPGYLATTLAMASAQWTRDDKDKAEKYLRAAQSVLEKNLHKEWFDTMDLA